MNFKAALVSVLFLVACHESHQHQVVEIAPVEITALLPPEPKVISRQELLAPLLEQVKQQEQEMLPFDEPKTEEGQQDGLLRPEWEHAYYQGHWTYEFNGDKYITMYNNRPHPPQVCADFIIDTIDRTAGTWYRSSLKRPAKLLGRYNLRGAAHDARLDPRRLGDLVDFFKQNPDKFTIVFDGEGPKTCETKKLKPWMKQMDVAIGDIIVIKGRAPWDDGKEIHWHSMFVTGLDEQGQVELVTGNPVYPVERTLRVEGCRTPKRRVINIIRMTDSFLHLITGL